MNGLRDRAIDGDGLEEIRRLEQLNQLRMPEAEPHFSAHGRDLVSDLHDESDAGAGDEVDFGQVDDPAGGDVDDFVRCARDIDAQLGLLLPRLDAWTP